mgnify:CR=1 FL=1
MKATEKVLLTAIAIERYGQDFYRRFSEIIDDENGKALMRGLGNDEKEHESLLGLQYERRFGRAPSKTIDVDLGLKAVREIFGSKKKIKKERDIMLDILGIAINVEEESIRYYSAKARNIKDRELSELLKNLTEIEKEHKILLEENLLHLKQDASWWGYVPILEG